MPEFCMLFEFSAKFLKKLNSCTPWLVENPSHVLEHTVLPEHLSKTLMPKSLSLSG